MTMFPHSGSLRCLFTLLVSTSTIGLVVGCGGRPAGPEGVSETHDDHDHDHDHGHDGEHAHDDHDHPPHGPHGGHLLDLDGGDVSVELAFPRDEDQVVVYFSEQGDAVTGVEMRYEIEGQEPKTFELTLDEALGKHAYQVKSPELMTAIQVGDAAGVKLIVTTADGEWTGDVRHFDH